MDEKTKEVLDRLSEDKDLKFVRIVFPDVLGRMLDFAVPSEELEDVIKNGKGFDGSSVSGFARTEESDLIIIPDAETLKILPWSYRSNSDEWKEAIIFGDIFNTKREHFQGDTRKFLKNVLERSIGFGEMKVGAELEFFLFPDSKIQELTDEGEYFSGGKYGEIRKTAQIHLRNLEILCECDHHEVAQSQHEIDLRYNRALEMADSIMLSRYVIKKAAEMHEPKLYASFMPKPIQGINGSGMHLHISLWNENKNLFFNSQEEPLSDTAKKYIMGLIKYGKDIQLVLNQWVNSYKRLTPGFEAPVYLAWGQKNRSAYIRVPEYFGNENGTRIEIRSPDPACNPYSTLAIVHLAGIQGIKENLEFKLPIEENIFEMDEKAREEKGIVSLSEDLGEALRKFRESEFIKAVLPKHLYDEIVRNKSQEWREFSRHVTDYEREKYFAFL